MARGHRGLGVAGGGRRRVGGRTSSRPCRRRRRGPRGGRGPGAVGQSLRAPAGGLVEQMRNCVMALAGKRYSRSPSWRPTRCAREVQRHNARRHREAVPAPRPAARARAADRPALNWEWRGFSGHEDDPRLADARKYLTAADLGPDKAVLVTRARRDGDQLGRRRPVAHFVGKKRGLVLRPPHQALIGLCSAPTSRTTGWSRSFEIYRRWWTVEGPAAQAPPPGAPGGPAPSPE